MDVFELIGQRLKVRTKSGRSLGLGTYVWHGDILLDSGKKAREEQCTWEAAKPSPVPPFEVKLAGDMRVFEGVRILMLSRYWLHKGDTVRIVAIEARPWNHGRYVAGKFFYEGEPHWLLMSELKLPFETA